ncbi:MAG: hypothetical protein WD598_01310 [Acidimicrobiia bacterium]
MGKFVQIIQFNTARIDEIRKLEEEYRAATESKRTSTRATVAVDRDDPTRHFVIVEFPSKEAAEKNNALPETADFAQKRMPLVDGPPTFYNLDVVEVEEL